MRLTLRTLLAYLDDTLDPSQARVIGQKIAESDAAQELIARIKQVTRRRRLTAPPASGPGAKLDPNTIAEYLDNEITEEQVASVEETCLASDVHLAEVAACHQLLTLMLGQPALVPPVARQRMYGLIQGREAIPYRKPPAARTARIRTEVPANAVPDEAEDTLLLGMPLYRRYGSKMRWLLPLAAVLLLVGSGLTLWMAINPAQVPTPTGSGRSGEQQLATVAPATEPKTDAGAKPDADAKTSEPKQPPPEAKAPPADAKKSAEPAGTPDPKTTPEAKAPAQPGGVAQGTPALPAAVKLPPPSTARKEFGKYVSPPMATPSVLMQLAGDKDQWVRVRPESRLPTTVPLVSLPGYRSEIRPDSNVQLMLWGDLPVLSQTPIYESGVIVYDNPEVDLDLKLDRGRVLLSNRKPAGPARVRVRVHEQIADLVLQDNTTEVVLVSLGFLAPGAPFRKEPPNVAWLGFLEVFVFKGQADVRVEGKEFAMPGPSRLLWNTQAADLSPPRPVERLPEWWTNRTLPQTKDARAWSVALDQLGARLTGRAGLEVVLAEAIKDPDSTNRRLAVRCLAATDDVSKLIDALNDEKHRDVRAETIFALLHWLGLRPNNDLRLFLVLRDQKKYPEGQAEIVMKLLHGFSEEEITHPATYETLLAYLLHEKLAIRELAAFHLSQLAPEGERKIRYDPAASEDQRQRAFQLWKQLIPDGKVPPMPTPQK